MKIKLNILHINKTVRAQKFQMTLHRENKCLEMAGMNMIHFYV